MCIELETLPDNIVSCLQMRSKGKSSLKMSMSMVRASGMKVSQAPPTLTLRPWCNYALLLV